MVNNKILLKLIERKAITPRVYCLKFFLVKPLDFSFKPGQFISILVPGENDKILRRSYSLINRPGDDLEIIYTHFPGGVASEYFKNLEDGSIVNALGPLGRFIMEEPMSGKYICVATGTGIGPFISMLRTIDFTGVELEIIFGCRTADDSICRDMYENFRINEKEISLTSCYSREVIEDKKSFNGYVQDKLRTMDINIDRDKFYLCGHPKMVEDVERYLLEINVPIKHIVKEKYVVAGLKG